MIKYKLYFKGEKLFLQCISSLLLEDAASIPSIKINVNLGFKLQEYDGAERQENRQTFHTREDVEIPLETVGDLLDTAVADAYRKTQFAGGLGYSTSRGLTLSEGMGKQINNYWQPPRKAAPIKYIDSSAVTYTWKETTQDWRDRMAAEKSGCNFIGIDSGGSSFKHKPKMLIRDFKSFFKDIIVS